MTYGYPSTLKRRTTSDVVARATGGVSYLRRLDWVLLGSALLLSVVGTLLVWSATREKQIGFGNDPDTYLKRNLLNIAHRARARVLLLPLRLPAAARVHADPVRAVDPRPRVRADACRGAAGQRGARVDHPAGRLLHPAVGVRQDRDLPRAVDDPGGEARRARTSRAASTSCRRSRSPPCRSR